MIICVLRDSASTWTKFIMRQSYSLICNVLVLAYFYPIVICTQDINSTLSTQTWGDKVMFWFMRNNTNGSQSNWLTPKTRVKRQGSAGAGKFSQAAGMSQTRVMQMWMQNFKNMFANAHIGGSHPLHKDVPKAFVGLFRQSIMAFFFPSVGEDKV